MNAGTVPVRSMYAAALDPECLPPAGAAHQLRTLLESTAGQVRSREELTAEATAWANAEREHVRAIAARAEHPGDHESVRRRALLGCAPLALRSGAWLQWLAGTGQADDPITLRVLGLYAGDAGVGHPGSSRGAAYLALLTAHELAAHVTPAANLVNDRRIGNGSFRLPAVLLAMSRLPDQFDAELVGADLCLRTVGRLPALSVVSYDLQGAGVDAIDPASHRLRALPAPLTLLDEIATAWSGREDRILRGFQWAFAELRRFSDELHAELEATLDPAYDMAELIRLRASEGAVYHDDVDLGERNLRALLRAADVDPGPLLDALAESRWVRPGDAARSLLTGRLLAEDGPMFRVFSASDTEIIRRWIDGLGDERHRNLPPCRAAARAQRARRPTVPVGFCALDTEGGVPVPRLRPREAYPLLLRREDTPALRAWAGRYVRDWLARSSYAIERSGASLPGGWNPDGLRPWLAEEHERHEKEFEQTAALPIPSRDELIDSTVQLAPLTLIDGAWLQGFTDYEQASSAIGFSLFETYWDELGNGETALNHPLIFRTLLDEMGVDLPPTADPEFARWKGFRDESFELPVYWLCLGRFPRTFLPEVLGMNLAMELSGVGGSYRRARLALRAHGFSTRFVDIHNTIDNIASGHSAWAADAIHTYIASLPHVSVREAWSRVRVGFRSLNPGGGAP